VNPEPYRGPKDAYHYGIAAVIIFVVLGSVVGHSYHWWHAFG